MRKGQDKAVPLHITQARKEGVRKGIGGQLKVPAALPPAKRAATLHMGKWVGLGPVWIGPENIVPAGVQPRTIQAAASK